MEEWRKEFIKQELKKQYDQITVPEEAKKRLEEGIRMAKEEKRKQGRIVKLRRTAGTAAAAAAAFIVLVNVSPTAAQAMEKLPVIGTIAKVVTFNTFEDQNGKMEAKVDIPQIQVDGEQPEANKEIEDYGRELISKYEQEVRDSQGDGNYALDSTYDVVFENDKYVSIRIRTTEIMASGTEYVKIFNVDKSTGKTVELMDMLGGDKELLEKISENIMQQMEDQMAADSNVIYFIHSEMPETDFKGLNGEESYYFNQNGELVIAFGEYEVAPGYMGAVEFTIPKTVTGDLV